MFDAYFYSLKLSWALAKLRINYNLISPVYMENIEYFARKDGLNPKETATFIFYRFSEKERSPQGEDIIKSWIKKNKVRHDKVVDLKNLAESKIDPIELFRQNDEMIDLDEKRHEQSTQKSYRYLIDDLFKKHPEINNSDDHNTHYWMKVVSLALFITTETVNRSGRNFKNINDKEFFVICFFCFVITEYISRVADVNAQMPIARALATLCNNNKKYSQEAGDILTIGRLYEQMAANPNQSEIIKAIGGNVLIFIETGNNVHLDQLGIVFNVLCTERMK